MFIFRACVMSLLVKIVSCFRHREKCVPFNIELCNDLQYNMTLSPNTKMDVDSLADGARLIREFSPLFNLGCYDNFKYFICNMFVPTCSVINNKPTPVYPCRHVCELARKKCEPTMIKYGAAWPDVLKCEYLKVADGKVLCGSPPDIKHSLSTNPTAKLSVSHWAKILLFLRNGIENFISMPDSQEKKHVIRSIGIRSPISVNFQTVCESTKIAVYKRKGGRDFCLTRCHANLLFKESDKTFANIWISIWSVICFFSTMLTVSTFLIDHKRFRYPERPIVFLSLCYNLFAVGFLIRVFSSYDQTACEPSEDGHYLAAKGVSMTKCTLVFFFLYFFGMASALWWTVLSFTWFLSAALKWSHEAIEKYSTVLHVVAWSTPTVQTIIVLVTKRIDVDHLSGVCFVGSSDSSDLLYFVAIPLLVYLSLGVVFLLCGFVALVKIRKIMRKAKNTDRFERLMFRIGIFSLLYCLPAVVVIGCYVYEYKRLKSLEEVTITACIADTKCMSEVAPTVEIFYLRYFMSLVVGVTSGVWIWTTKTFNSWKRFYGLRSDNKMLPRKRNYLRKSSCSLQHPPSLQFVQPSCNFQPYTDLHNIRHAPNTSPRLPPIRPNVVL